MENEIFIAIVFSLILLYGLAPQNRQQGFCLRKLIWVLTVILFFWKDHSKLFVIFWIFHIVFFCLGQLLAFGIAGNFERALNLFFAVVGKKRDVSLSDAFFKDFELS